MRGREIEREREKERERGHRSRSDQAYQVVMTMERVHVRILQDLFAWAISETTLQICFKER